MNVRHIMYLVLVIAAIASGYAALENEPSFRVEVWSQVFWLILSAMAIPLVLEGLLQHDNAVHGRIEDAFAFRTFATQIIGRILQICRRPNAEIDVLVKAALANDKDFARALGGVVQPVESSDVFDTELYGRTYIDVGGELRSLSIGYIRLFAKNRAQMVALYRRLQDVASTWQYEEALTAQYAQYTLSLNKDDEHRGARETETKKATKRLHDRLVNTATTLRDLAARVSNRGRADPKR